MYLSGISFWIKDKYSKFIPSTHSNFQQFEFNSMLCGLPTESLGKVFIIRIFDDLQENFEPSQNIRDGK